MKRVLCEYKYYEWEKLISHMYRNMHGDQKKKTRNKSFSITAAVAATAALATANKNASFVITCVGEGHVIHMYAILYIT